MNDCTFVVFTGTHVSIFARVPEISSPEVSTNGGNTGRLLYLAARNPFMWCAPTEVPGYLPMSVAYGTMQAIGEGSQDQSGRGDVCCDCPIRVSKIIRPSIQDT